MKFITSQNRLIEVLAKVSGPVSSKQNFPILNCVLIETLQDKVKLTTTDLDSSVIAYLTTPVEKEGKVAVPFKRLVSIARELPKQEVTIEKVKENLCISCEKIEFKINCMEAEDFPQIDEEVKENLITLSSSDLLEMIKMTSFCVGGEELNYVLSGILFEIVEDKINLVATDGKRLSFIQKKLPSTQAEISTKLSFILPIKAVHEIQKLIKEKKEIFLFIKDGNVGIDCKDTLFFTKTVEGEFPNYSQYIPAPVESKLTIRRSLFLSALKRAQLLSTPDHQGVKLELQKDELILSKSTPQLGELKESLEANYTGTPLQISFNPVYLIDVLKNIDEEMITFEIYGEDKPAVLRKEDYIYLVLPIKL